METVTNSVICGVFLPNNSFLYAKLVLSFEKQAIYQIKFCTFVTVRQKNTNMNRIKEVLEAKGISQTELANRLGKTFNMVNMYASNKVQPPIPVLYRIADILNVDVRDLLISNLINKGCANGEKRD